MSCSVTFASARLRILSGQALALKDSNAPTAANGQWGNAGGARLLLLRVHRAPRPRPQDSIHDHPLTALQSASDIRNQSR
jgi:hypothetical protein